MNVREAAQLYISRGWRVVPLEPSSKACKDTDWLKLVFKPIDFRDGDNIGIRAVDGLVDVDLDAQEAVAVAGDFLPATGAIYGRTSKPRSHWLYRSAFEKPLKYEDQVNKTTLLELRVNHQSMAPPSVHPSGEVVSWAGDLGVEAEAVPASLTRQLQLTATASLIARYYNPKGARHDWGVALAGSLRLFGLTEAEVVAVVTAAARVAGDTEVGDRRLAIRTTFSKPDSEPLASTKALEAAATHGAQFVASLRRFWGAEALGIPKNKLEELNAKHAVVFQQSGDLIVITEDVDIDGKQFLRFSDPQTIKLLYPEPVVVGLTARGAPQTKPLGQAWLSSPQRRFYSGIELAPNGRATPGYYNMWRGFTVEPKPGDWSKLRWHLEYIVCAGDRRLSEYVLAWLAAAVQQPGKQAETAICIRGKQGTGKGLFIRTFGKLFGQHFLHLDSSRHLTGNFNAHLHNAIVVFADEAAWPGDKAGQGALKRMITEPTISIERKGQDIFTVPNVIHMLMAGNEQWVAPVDFDDRRFCVLDILPDKVEDFAYFEGIRLEMDVNGGLAGMLYDLLAWRSDVNLRLPPDTTAKFEQKILSMDGQQRWWFHVLHDRDDLWVEEYGEGAWHLERDALYDDYVTVLNKVGQTRLSAITELAILMHRMLPKGYPEVVRHKGKRYWLLPSLKVCRECFDTTFKLKGESAWPAEAGYKARDDGDIPF